MKVADLYSSKHFQDRIAGVLDALGVKEQAAYAINDDDDEREVLVATDAGLIHFRQERNPQAGHGAYILRFDFTPWQDAEFTVRGDSYAVIEEDLREGVTLIFELTRPEIRIESRSRTRTQVADFVRACLAAVRERE